MNTDIYMQYRKLTGYELYQRTGGYIVFHDDKRIAFVSSYDEAMHTAIDHNTKQKRDMIENAQMKMIAAVDYEIKAHEDSLLILSLKIAELKKRKDKIVNLCSQSKDGKIHRLEDCELSVRTANCLENAGFDYLEDVYIFVQSEGEAGLLKLKNFGRKSLNEIKDLFEEYGLV